MPKNNSSSTDEKPPQLVAPGVYNPHEKQVTYRAVDYLNIRMHVGDHVAINAGGSMEWVGLIESLFVCPERQVPVFRCRWFWGFADVKEHAVHHHMDKNSVTSFRPSRLEACELLLSDTRDINRVDTIMRKCTVLSWNNLCRVKKQAMRSKGPWAGIYYCERLYKDKSNEIFDLSNILFPGDPIPPALLEELEYGCNDQGEARDRPGNPPYLVSNGPAGMQRNDKEKHENPPENINRTHFDENELNPHAVYII